MAPAHRPRRVGIVVHPARDVEAPLETIRDWCAQAGSELVQIATTGSGRQVAPPAGAETCDVIVSVGGDGTMLSAIRASAPTRCPVIGVAVGSLGVLTRTPPAETAGALDRFAAGDWTPRHLPALEIERDDGPSLRAFNDIAIVRAGIGQIRVVAELDGARYARIAGDGVIVCTPQGSGAYTLAASGPLLAPGAEGFVLTPLASHGGNVPSLVAGPRSRLVLEIGQGYGGARLEVDGQIVAQAPSRLEVTLVGAVATLVTYGDREPLVTVLRARGIIVDSPRILAEDARLAAEGQAAARERPSGERK